MERERQQYRQELKSSQKQISIIQQTLSNTDQRAAKAESTSARLSSQMEELLKEFQHTKSAYNTLQQKYEKVLEYANFLFLTLILDEEAENRR